MHELQDDAEQSQLDPWQSDAAFLRAIIETQRDVAEVEFAPRAVMQMIVERTQQLTGSDGAAIELIEGEFVAVIPDLADTSAAAVVAAKIIGAFAAPFHICGAPVNVTCSVGVSLFPEDG